MKFQPDRPIYLQIADLIANQIARGELPEEGRVPAVRDLALEFEVNPNTVVKGFADLEERQVISKKRGLGFFVCKDARALLLGSKRADFLEKQLPQVVHSMIQLGIELEEFEQIYQKFKNRNVNS